MTTERLPLTTKDGRGNLIRAFKASGCADCGRRYPELDWSELHIDHINPSDKVRRTSSMTHFAGGGGISDFKSGGYEALLAELLLCQVLCREHHAEKHRNGNGHALIDQLALFSGSGEAWRLLVESVRPPVEKDIDW